MIQGIAAALLFALLAALPVPSDARIERNRSEVRAFRAESHCPATGLTRGACPGYVVDHVKPLCAGGIDHPSNMQWQTIGDAKAKDREERRVCRFPRP